MQFACLRSDGKRYPLLERGLRVPIIDTLFKTSRFLQVKPKSFVAQIESGRQSLALGNCPVTESPKQTGNLRKKPLIALSHTAHSLPGNCLAPTACVAVLNEYG